MNLKPSASMEIAGIADEIQKKGGKVYSLSIGDTHFPPPELITEKLSKLSSPYSHYTISQGIAELREEIAGNTADFFNASEVLITPGLKQGLYYALEALDGKRVCVLEPAWLGYKALTVITKKEYLFVNTNDNNWVEKLAAMSFDILIICCPNNPNGKILGDNEIDSIIECAGKNNAWIITDEIYEIYDYRKQSRHKPIKKVYNYEKVIIGNGLSKSHAVTGFRIGYLITRDKALMKKMNIIHQNLGTCTPAISQYLCIGFSNMMQQVIKFKEYYSINREEVINILPGLTPFKPDGGFYYFIDLREFGINNAGEFCKALLENEHVALIPGDAYGSGFSSYVRLSFSVDNVLLREAMQKLAMYINKYNYKQ